MRTVLNYSLTATVGIAGIQVLFNQDVILAEHYLRPHDGGIYGALSKIGSIIYYLTLSVSQVLFPRVVDAAIKRQHFGHMLLLSASIVMTLGSAVIVIYAVAPSVVVAVLFGAGYTDADHYVVAIGLVALCLSLNNLLVQFFMAANDRWFMPALAASCVVEATLIILFHAGVENVVIDVLTSQAVLLLLMFRCYVYFGKPRDRFRSYSGV
jgi:O-antigen/teichoic acid export membrane protein